MNVQHSACLDAWETPDAILALIRRVLGDIELDPASSPGANQRVRAARILTAEDDALSTPWGCVESVYLNPPGGKIGNRSKAGLFWARLLEHRAELGHAIFAFFSIEGLQISQNYAEPALHFPLCIPRKRIRWVHPTERKGSPSHSNVFVYVPGRIDRTEDFLRTFEAIGAVSAGLGDRA